MKDKIPLLCFLLATIACVAHVHAEEIPLKKIIFVGDSTVQNYPDDGPKRGWGQVLPLFFGSRAECKNAAAGGRSTKTFVGEGRWKKVLEEKPDVIFIQFGHNDSHAKDRPESTDASTDYKSFLGQYVSEGKAAGAKIILVTPMHRRYFGSQGKLKDILGPYAETTRAVARETGTPCIDLHQLSRELLEKLGETDSEALFCSPTDRTHFSKKGATTMARFIAEAISKDIPDLKPYLKDSREWPE